MTDIIYSIHIVRSQDIKNKKQKQAIQNDNESTSLEEAIFNANNLQFKQNFMQSVFYFKSIFPIGFCQFPFQMILHY